MKLSTMAFSSRGLSPNKADLLRRVGYTRRNYWHQELLIIRTEMENDSQHPIRSLPDYSSVHDLLDCYMYLKLYSIWGTERLGHLRDQVQLYQHVAQLWKDFGNARVPSTSKKGKTSRTDVDQVLINDAVNLLRGDLDRRLKKCCESGDEEQAAEILAYTLIHDQLLFPSDEFVQSVKEGEEHEGKIPKALIRIWVPVLNVVASRGMSPELCRGLMAMAMAKDTGLCAGYAAEWLNIILTPLPVREEKEAPPGKKRKDRRSNNAAAVLEPPVLKNDSAKWKTLLEETLMSPGRASLEILPRLFRLQSPRLSAAKEKSLLALMGSYLAERKVSVSKEGSDGANEAEMRTLSDVVPDGDGGAGWTWVNTRAPEWRVCPLGVLPGQAHQDLDSGWMEDELDARTTARDSPYFEVALLDWPSLVRDEEQRRSRAAKKKCTGLDSDPDGENVPAFYRSNGNGKRLRR